MLTDPKGNVLFDIWVPLISVQKVTVPSRPESEHLRGSGSLAQGKSLSGNDFLLIRHSACEALFVRLISCGGACFAGPF